jgi:Uma2 family endonuclease
MAVQAQSMTVEEFDRFVDLPENASRLFEYIGGEVVEVVSSARSSKIALRIGYFIIGYLLQHDIGHATGADGGYRVGIERYIPDVGFISRARLPDLPDLSYIPQAPDLAVEVLSPSNSEKDMRTKVVNYLSVGTVVWVVDPEFKLVEVYQPSQPVKKVRLDDTLDGGEVLPGFTVAVKDLFQA